MNDRSHDAPRAATIRHGVDCLGGLNGRPCTCGVADLIDELAQLPSGRVVAVPAPAVLDLSGVVEDADLFRYWAEEASLRPARIARFLASCTSPNDFRVALRAAMASPIDGKPGDLTGTRQ